MKYSISEFLNALETRIDELDEAKLITGASSISSNFSDEELEKFDSIKEEAFALSNNDDEAEEFIYNRLTDLGYTDDEITQIFDYEEI